MLSIKQEMRLFIMLMVFWVILAGEWSPRQLISGVLICLLAIVIYHWVLRNSGADRVSWIRFSVVLHFACILVAEIFRSAMMHLKRIITGHGGTSDCRLLLHVDEELVVALIANAITLTPGTVTLEADRNNLTVLYYGMYPNQCPLELVLMVERLQNPFLLKRLRMKEVDHA